MIATHSAKVFNAKLQQSAICARPIDDIPSNFICSKNVRMRREFWAAPHNAAKMKEWREQIPCDEKFPDLENLPDLNDHRIKQILLPQDWRKGNYISVTPVPSMGILHEVYMRLRDRKLPYMSWKIQSNPTAIVNHGEMLMIQSGVVRMFRRGMIKTELNEGWVGDCIQMTARCEGMNISPGMVAVGWPAITSIGGMTHVLERNTGCDIQFAFGLRKTAQWVKGVPLMTAIRSGTKVSVNERVKAKRVDLIPVPAYSKDEVHGNLDVILLFKSDGNLNDIAKSLRNIHRLSGGALFDIKISVIRNDSISEEAIFLIDESQSMRTDDDNDILDVAMHKYGLDGSWTDDGIWEQRHNGYTVNMTGYMFLEQPCVRLGVRSVDYAHAWVEPVFSVVSQGRLSHAAWWQRKSNFGGVFWQNVGSGDPALRYTCAVR